MIYSPTRRLLTADRTWDEHWILSNNGTLVCRYTFNVYIDVDFMFVFSLNFRMKKKYYSWDECLNLREVKVSNSETLKIWLCPPLKKSVSLSVYPSVTFLFLINNSRTPWPTFLKLGLHIHPRQQRNPIDVGSKVKVTRVNCAKTVSGCFSNTFTKWISSSYICATYYELTSPVVQNICDQIIFRGHNVLQTSLVLLFLHKNSKTP